MNSHNMSICQSLGVDSFLDKRVSKLSGGMKKRLSLAITMMSDPDLLLLDEPLASLDLLCKNGILRYLQNYITHGQLKVSVACRHCQDAESVLQAKPRHSKSTYVDAVGKTTERANTVRPYD